MKSKAQLIKEYLTEPIKIGDSVNVRGLGIQNKSQMGNSVEVLEVHKDNSITIKEHRHNPQVVKPEDYEKNLRHIGYDPFKKRLRVTTFNSDLNHMLHIAGWERKHDGVMKEDEMNWNPTVTAKDGEKIVFQRDFVWTMEDKQLLIDSIYNNRDIGKFLIRRNDISKTIDLQNEGKKAYFRDMIDGKQRLNAILEFVRNEFSDFNGNHFNDFSDNAKHSFLNYMNFSFGEIDENATDIDIIDMFLMVNHSGKQMSPDHIDFVKEIRNRL